MWQLIVGFILISVTLCIAFWMLYGDQAGKSVWSIFALLCVIVWGGGYLIYVAGGERNQSRAAVIDHEDS